MGDNLLVEGNEIAYNNYQRRFAFGWELGGAKFAQTRNAVIRGNYVHHNYGNGLWTDTDNIHTLYENNRVTDNAGAGIFHEISYDAVIRNNTVERNGSARGWYYGAGILVGHSPNVQVYGNRVAYNKKGIIGLQQERGNGDFGAHHLKNLSVYNNTVTMASGQTGVATDLRNNAVFSSRNNRFRSNTYYLRSNGRPFTWMKGDRTVQQWRSYGQDAGARFNR
jgi:parallel beta-helix repeat protein